MNYKNHSTFKITSKIKLSYKKSKSGITVNNKSKSKDFLVTNFDKAFEKYIRSQILKKFPNDSIIGEEFKDKYHQII